MADNNKKLILIVDDVERNQQVLAAILFQNGYDVAVAQSGSQALEMLKNIHPELILLDIMMPDMDGIEACRHIMRNENTMDIPVIFLTALSEKDEVVRGFQAGAVDYVTKPFNSEELLARVKTQIELKEKSRRIAELNEHLEEKVEERTRQLAEANKRLKNLDSAKTYLLGLLSHELNTPLSGIKGFAQILQTTLKDPEQLEFLKDILESADRLQKFADISLLITKLKTEKYNLEKNKIYLRGLLQEVIYSVQNEFLSKNLTFNNSVQEDLKTCADEYLLSQGIRIILHNAAKFSPERGVIRLSSVTSDDRVMLSIADYGPGFSNDMLKNLFDMFTSGELLQHKEGFGLSLAAVKLIMDMHGGSIKVENRQDGGALVTLIFDRNQD